MACSSCAAMRQGFVQAVRRGQLGTASAIAKKGVRHAAKSIKAPAVIPSTRKR